MGMREESGGKGNGGAERSGDGRKKGIAPWFLGG